MYCQWWDVPSYDTCSLCIHQALWRWNMATSASTVRYSSGSKKTWRRLAQESNQRGKEYSTTQKLNVRQTIRDCEVAQTLFLFHSITRMFRSMHAGLDTHPARMNTHLYTVYGGAAQDHERYVYLIDEHKKIINLVWIKSDHSQPKIKDKMIRYVLIVNNLISAQKNQ